MEQDEYEVSDNVKRLRVEENEDWRKWGREAPWLQFPPELEVSIVPPFGGAMARFHVRFIGGERHVSVYWDCLDRIGFMQRPYWEIYPVKFKSNGEDQEDCKRFLMGQEPEMMASIFKSLLGEYDE